jgi:toxin ParE1/3/4
MARVVWTEPALNDLEAIAEYIALDKPDAARRYVHRVFQAVERLARFPKSGSIPPEIPHLPYRQVVVPPCRVFYRTDGEDVLVVFVMRSERRLREADLTEPRTA